MMDHLLAFIVIYFVPSKFKDKLVHVEGFVYHTISNSRRRPRVFLRFLHLFLIDIVFFSTGVYRVSKWYVGVLRCCA